MSPTTSNWPLPITRVGVECDAAEPRAGEAVGDGDMRKRWCVAGLLRAESKFRRRKGPPRHANPSESSGGDFDALFVEAALWAAGRRGWPPSRGNVAARRLYAAAGGRESPEPFVMVEFELGPDQSLAG